MQKESKLKISYDKQRELFENRKEERLKNIERSLEEIEIKISNLQLQRQKLIAAKKKNQDSSFRSFPEFLQQAAKQADEARPKKNT